MESHTRCRPRLHRGLTCYLQRCIATPCRSGLVLGDAPVDAAILLLLAVHGLEEEQVARVQLHAMGFKVPRTRLDRFAILEPLDGGLWLSLCLAVERRGLVAGHHHVQGMLGDSWHLDGCKEKFPSIKIRLYGFFVPLNCQRVTWMERGSAED